MLVDIDENLNMHIFYQKLVEYLLLANGVQDSGDTIVRQNKEGPIYVLRD